ncbi:hypothetical protein [Porphyromonas sp. COT-052 OH4946]|uniref:hypothetical protein n=1 Tax=Porphyromonas sp. COT-052 OH4946 TaxID=1515618 RepID=UPI0009DD4625|nr:hypothetical protein [Porphyromonas sp. COT-052 OH4946]
MSYSMASNTYKVLKGQGYTPEQDLVSRKMRKKLVVTEKNQRYELDCSASTSIVLGSCVFAIDGGVIPKETSTPKCDKLILCALKIDGQQAKGKLEEEESWLEIFVELKGHDVEHAIDQLEATLKNNLFVHDSNKLVLARIVATSIPSNRSNPKLEKAKIRFRKNYRCELKTIKSNNPERY